MQRSARMKKEIQMFQQSPPHGISCWCKDDRIDHLEARIQVSDICPLFLDEEVQLNNWNIEGKLVSLEILGGSGTPYEGGIYKLEIQIPDRYPFEPPKVRFITPIYHPNIDNGGRICLDTLKMPPKGAWKPCLNVSTLLTTIQLLMAEPNPEDPLMTDISSEFKYNKAQYIQHAKEWNEKYAMEQEVTKADVSRESENEKKSKVLETAGGIKRTQPMADVTNKKLKDS